MGNAVIRTEHLTKVYKARTEWEFSMGRMPTRRQYEATRALSDLNLTVEQGEIFGYLGPNGAGKTTTIRLLLDLIRPTAGRAFIFDMDANAQSVEVHKRIGFLPGELNLWKNRTARQVVNYFAQVRAGANAGPILRYADELAERLDFNMNKPVRDYSSGNKRKLGLILALMHKPDLLILDEPTSGLDPLMQQTFNQLMLEVKEEGRTVFMSSHVLSEVQAICDRVGILRHGELKAVESVSKLTHTDFRWVTVRLKEQVSADTFKGIEGVSDVSAVNGELRFRLTGDFDPLLRALSQYYVVDLRTQDPTLEEIFLAFYGDQPVRNHNNGAAVKEQVQ